MCNWSGSLIPGLINHTEAVGPPSWLIQVNYQFVILYSTQVLSGCISPLTHSELATILPRRRWNHLCDIPLLTLIINRWQHRLKHMFRGKHSQRWNPARPWKGAASWKTCKGTCPATRHQQNTTDVGTTVQVMEFFYFLFTKVLSKSKKQIHLLN